MITIIDYGVGNLASISNMIRQGGGKAIITNNLNDIKNARKIILPGMGHFDNCMQKFNSSGLREIITEKVFVEKIPLLGICVGLQMLMASSEEGNEKGLGWVKGSTIKFSQSLMHSSNKIPNMGWLDVKAKKDSPILEGLKDPRFYFAHSYHVKIEESSDILLSAVYGYDFTVAIEKGNLIGVQFHPEKSHRFGMQLLKNFFVNY